MKASITTTTDAPKRIGCTLVSLAIPAGILTAFLFSMLWIGGVSVDPWGAVLLFGGAAVVVAAGEIPLKLAGLDTISASLPVAIVMGSAVVVTSVIITWRKVPPLE
jgi:hypothetical protein